MPEALTELKNSGYRCFAFSNGSHEAVYQHFTDTTASNTADTWLISSNSFDVIGAAAAGWNTAWLQRDTDVVFDPWQIEPTQIIRSLAKFAV